jgi:hypothetical protein
MFLLLDGDAGGRGVGAAERRRASPLWHRIIDQIIAM